jgi:hypothetical protein
MTMQEMYELMRIYLTRPGARQAIVEGNCVYESAIEGEIHRCAIGCLLTPPQLGEKVLITQEIADEQKTMIPFVGEEVALRDFQGSLAGLTMAGYSWTQDLDDSKFDFLASAQSIHDLPVNWGPEGFRVEALDSIAARRGLKVVTEVEQKEVILA